MLVEQREMIDLAALGGLITIPAQPNDPALARALHELRGLLAAQQARIDGIATILAPPTDTPAALGTLADLTACLDAQQRQLASITAPDGTQASIMGSLDALQRHLASITAAVGTQASIMGSLALLAARLDQQQQATARAQQALATQLDTQQQALDRIGRTSDRVGRLMRHFLRLRARLLGRRFEG